MPLFEVRAGRDLIPFRQLKGGAELYEEQIESLLWADPEAFTAEALLKVRRQPTIDTGGRPDIILLDASGRIVVVEIKRDIERTQLSQCLEYAGWARKTGLDTIASLYHAGEKHFYEDWMEFTGSTSPMAINRNPRVILVARGFHERTDSALKFLMDNELPVQKILVALYQDESGRTLLDIEGDEEPPARLTTPASTTSPRPQTRTLRRAGMAELLEAGLLKPGDRLTWVRRKLGQTHEATILENGSIRLSDGRVFSTPSRAAGEVGGPGAFDGWKMWRAGGPDGPLLHELRVRYLESTQEPAST